MPKRPRSHQLEDISRNRLHRFFEGNGWTVEDLSKDYGEDLLVRIFDNGVSTPLSFFIQAKATDNLSRFLGARTSSLKCPVSTEHLKHWSRFQEPVILTLWDAKSDETFWTCIQETKVVTSRSSRPNRLMSHVPIPRGNRLDEKSLKTLRLLTLGRYKRLLREAQGAKTLIELLSREFNIEVEYSAKDGIVSVQVPGEDLRMAFFGPTGARMQKLCAHLKASPEQILHKALESSLNALNQYERTGTYPTWNPKTNKLKARTVNPTELRQIFKAEGDSLDEEQESNLDYDDEPL
jgi:hypothetical protein